MIYRSNQHREVTRLRDSFESCHVLEKRSLLGSLYGFFLKRFYTHNFKSTMYESAVVWCLSNPTPTSSSSSPDAVTVFRMSAIHWVSRVKILFCVRLILTRCSTIRSMISSLSALDTIPLPFCEVVPTFFHVSVFRLFNSFKNSTSTVLTSILPCVLLCMAINN